MNTSAKNQIEAHFELQEDHFLIRSLVNPSTYYFVSDESFCLLKVVLVFELRFGASVNTDFPQK